MFAIINTRTKKFVYGTDYRYCFPRQRLSTEKMLTFETAEEAQAAMNLRCISKKSYRICEFSIDLASKRSVKNETM